MKPQTIRLFIKPYCGWCHEVMEWLDSRSIPYETLDVIANPAARKEMFQLSGQSLAPVIDVDGEVLADFGAEELAEWWKQQGFEGA
jgi:glutaredoxin